MHIERFSVISEFGQNALNPFATSNFKGVDLRIRTQLTANWWVGSRLSHNRTLVGPVQSAYRLRIESQFKF